MSNELDASRRQALISVFRTAAVGGLDLEKLLAAAERDADEYSAGGFTLAIKKEVRMAHAIATAPAARLVDESGIA